MAIRFDALGRAISAFALLALAGTAPAQSIGGTPFLAVHGSAKVQVVPDLFPVEVEIHEVGMDLSRSQATVEALTRDTLAKARALGLADADITVGNLSVSANEEYDSTLRKSVFRGNDYRRSLQFQFHSLADLKAFLGGVPAGKQVSVDVLRFKSSVEDETRRQLLADAVANARKAADILAAAIGRRVGIAQTISTSPLSLAAGSYINAADVQRVESTTILTAQQIRRIPVPRDITSVALLAPGTVRGDVVLEQGAVEFESDVYIVYMLED